jgi:hypothetical protein
MVGVMVVGGAVDVGGMVGVMVVGGATDVGAVVHMLVGCATVGSWDGGGAM